MQHAEGVRGGGGGFGDGVAAAAVAAAPLSDRRRRKGIGHGLAFALARGGGLWWSNVGVFAHHAIVLGERRGSVELET